MDCFLLITLVTIFVTGISSASTFNINDNIRFTNTAFAQEVNNESTVVIPSQTGKMEITLKDAPTNEPDYSLYIQIITAISSAAAAIFGGYIASRYAHKKAMEMEKMKLQQEKQKEADIERKQERQKEEYRQNVAAVLYTELGTFKGLLSAIKSDEYWGRVEELGPKMLSSAIESYRMEFLKIPFDIKLTLFNPQALYHIQNAYDYLESYRSVFLSSIAVYTLIDDLKINIQKITVEGYEVIVEKAILELENFLPKSVLEKFQQE